MPTAPDPSGPYDDPDSLLSGLIFFVPDDARALDADRDAYYAERAARQAPDLEQPQPRRRLSGPLVVAVLLVVAVVGSMMTVLAPRNAAAPAARPMATSGLQAPGQVGGLLPDAMLSIGPVQVLARTLRPAVFIVIPADCPRCTETVAAVLLQVRARRLQLVLVGAPTQAGQLISLEHTGAGGQATLALDWNGAMARAYGGLTPTVVIVAPDGVVTAVEPNVTRALALDPDLYNALRAA